MGEAKCARVAWIVSVILMGPLAGEGLPGVGADPSAPQAKEGVAIELSRFEITPETLELCYDLRNDSNDDVWVCTDLDHYSYTDWAPYLSDDGQTLKLVRRPDLPAGGPDLAYISCRFARLPGGETLTESLSFALPIFSPYRSNVELVKANRTAVRRLNLDVGCYTSSILGQLPLRSGGSIPVDERVLLVPTAVEMLQGADVLLRATIDGVRIPLEMGDPQSYPVYADLLAQWLPKSRQVVIKAWTTLDHVGIGYVAAQLESVGDDTLRDFRRKNLAPVRLEEQFIDDPNVVLATDPLSEGWKAFRERYPDSSGLTEVSCVGFSDDHAEALAYIGHGSGALTGSGYVVLLCWNGSAWDIRDFVRVWVS